MSPCVPRRGDDYELLVDCHFVLTGDDSFDTHKVGAIVSVHDALEIEVSCEPFVIRNVVTMGEEHEARAAELFDSLYQRPGEARRVDEYVAPVAPVFWLANDEVTPRAEA